MFKIVSAVVALASINDMAQAINVRINKACDKHKDPRCRWGGDHCEVLECEYHDVQTNKDDLVKLSGFVEIQKWSDEICEEEFHSDRDIDKCFHCFETTEDEDSWSECFGGESGFVQIKQRTTYGNEVVCEEWEQLSKSKCKAWCKETFTVNPNGARATCRQACNECF